MSTLTKVFPCCNDSSINAERSQRLELKSKWMDWSFKLLVDFKYSSVKFPIVVESNQLRWAIRIIESFRQHCWLRGLSTPIHAFKLLASSLHTRKRLLHSRRDRGCLSWLCNTLRPASTLVSSLIDLPYRYRHHHDDDDGDDDVVSRETTAARRLADSEFSDDGSFGSVMWWRNK